MTIGRKLDFDRRNQYQIEIVAADLGEFMGRLSHHPVLFTIPKSPLSLSLCSTLSPPAGTPSLSGTASLTVNIINSNDKDPYFTPATQRAEIAEDAAIGTVVHRLVALDPDVASVELLSFAATEPITAVDKDGLEINAATDADPATSYRHLFDVDRSGRVTVARKLNRDLYAVVRIPVLVTDTTAPVSQQGHGLLVITIIDVNEMPPVSRMDGVIYLFFVCAAWVGWMSVEFAVVRIELRCSHNNVGNPLCPDEWCGGGCMSLLWNEYCIAMQLCVSVSADKLRNTPVTRTPKWILVLGGGFSVVDGSAAAAAVAAARWHRSCSCHAMNAMAHTHTHTILFCTFDDMSQARRELERYFALAASAGS